MAVKPRLNLCRRPQALGAVEDMYGPLTSQTAFRSARPRTRRAGHREVSYTDGAEAMAAEPSGATAHQRGTKPYCVFFTPPISDFKKSVSPKNVPNEQ